MVMKVVHIYPPFKILVWEIGGSEAGEGREREEGRVRKEEDWDGGGERKVGERTYKQTDATKDRHTHKPNKQT